MAITTKSLVALVLTAMAALTSASPTPQDASSPSSATISSSPSLYLSSYPSSYPSARPTSLPASIILTALLPGAVPPHRPLTAVFGKFLVFNHTTLPPTFCPSSTSPGYNASTPPQNITCPPPSNATVFTISSWPHVALALSVLVPGGQGLYVGPDDSFSYTVPHAGSAAPGNGTVTDLSFILNENGVLEMVNRRWCLLEINGAGEYQVFLLEGETMKLGCVDVDVAFGAWDGGVGAWEYM